MKLRDFSEFQKVMEMMDDYMSLVISLGAKVCGITYDSRKYYEFEFVIEESGTIYLNPARRPLPYLDMGGDELQQ